MRRDAGRRVKRRDGIKLDTESGKRSDMRIDERLQNPLIGDRNGR